MLHLICAGIRDYEQRIGRYPGPTSVELVEQLGASLDPSKLSLRRFADQKTHLVDAWDRAIVYQVLIDENGKEFMFKLYSVGANGLDEQGMGDDIWVQYPW